MPKISQSTALYLFLIPITLICIFRSWDQFTTHIRHHKNLAHADAGGYYMYLPALFIHQGFENLPLESDRQFHKIDKTNRYYNKYTYGVSLLQVPFFLIADLVAGLSHYERTGYSRPYQLSILFSAFIYFFIGMFVLKKALSLTYQKEIVWIVLLAISFGTNLMYYTFVESGMSHVYNFFLCSLMIYFTPIFYKNISWRNTMILGTIFSLMVFIRPTNIILTLYFFFYSIHSWKHLKERGTFFLNHKAKLIAMALPFFILACGQVALWSHMWGSFVFFSYNTEPGFIFWFNPKILSVWFHVWNGLFIYTPILLFAIIGLLIGIRQKQNNHWSILIIFLLSSYVFGSWWAWWFGGAYGARSFIGMLPLLAFPMAYLTHQLIVHKHIFLKVVSIAAYYVFVFYSIRMSAKYKPPWDGENWNWESWWEVVKTLL